MVGLESQHGVVGCGALWQHVCLEVGHNMVCVVTIKWWCKASDKRDAGNPIFNTLCKTI